MKTHGEFLPVESRVQSSERAPEGTRGWKSASAQLDAVLAFCATDWRTLAEIAEAVERSQATVRTKYLKPLLEHGMLVRKFPKNPRHPHQAYRAAKQNGL